MIESNTLFPWLLSIAIALILVFVGTAIYSAYRRKESAGCFEVLRSMIFDPMFLAAAGAVILALTQSNYEAMFIAALSFIGYKVVATEIVIAKNNDYRYTWFGDGSSWNKWASAIISTKTIILVFTSWAIWTAGFNGLFDATLVSERVLELVAAWGLANGIPAITMLKGKNFSFLNPVPKPYSDVQQITLQYKPQEQAPVIAQGTSEYGPENTSWDIKRPEYQQTVFVQTLPIPDTKVPYTGEDLKEISEGAMPPALVQAIGEVFARIATVTAKMPNIPKPSADLLPYELPNAYNQRVRLAEQNISDQAWTKQFTNSELDDLYKLRGSCSETTWRRINHLFDVARDRWVMYNLALWQYWDTHPE